jgi:BASS family bile acid:Na+ symporter
LLGYFSTRALGFDKMTCRTVSLEVGLQNAGMAAGIAAELKMVTTLGLAPIIFGPVMNVTASSIANWWRIHPAAEIMPPAAEENAERGIETVNQ